jgi:HEPN domain-containing protein
VCFHIQQGAEKLLKAALTARNLEYPFTHDLRELLDLARKHYPEFEPFRDTLPEYTEFAVVLRYDDIPWIDEDEARTALGEVTKLRGLVAGHVEGQLCE